MRIISFGKWAPLKLIAIIALPRCSPWGDVSKVLIPDPPVPLLSLTSLAMADDIGPSTVGTGQELENHDATRSRWECLTSETLIEDSTSTPLRHLWTGHVGGPSGDGQGDRHTAKPRLVGVQTRTPGSETVSERGLWVGGHLGEQTCAFTQ